MNRETVIFVLYDTHPMAGAGCNRVEQPVSRALDGLPVKTGGGDDGNDDGGRAARPPRPVPAPHKAMQSRKGELNRSRTCS